MLAQDLLAKRKWKDTGQAKTTEGDVASPPSRRAAAEPIAELDQIFSKAKRPAVSVEQKKVLPEFMCLVLQGWLRRVDREHLSTMKCGNAGTRKAKAHISEGQQGRHIRQRHQKGAQVSQTCITATPLRGPALRAVPTPLRRKSPPPDKGHTVAQPCSLSLLERRGSFHPIPRLKVLRVPAYVLTPKANMGSQIADY